MGKDRLEAFSDGVIAIIITIMVLELKVPHEATFSALVRGEIASVFASYVLSFVYVGIYWNNHHHLLQGVRSVSGGMLWANMHLLFWLSLMPFATAWMGENHFAEATMIMYGALLMMTAIAYTILVRTIIAHDGGESVVARAVGADWKGYISLLLYAVGIAGAFASRSLSALCYVSVALIWFIPDKRIERELRRETHR